MEWSSYLQHWLYQHTVVDEIQDHSNIQTYYNHIFMLSLHQVH
jgi:hypothetical protein